jgi:iron(III) transport system ATP-binding protein
VNGLSLTGITHAYGGRAVVLDASLDTPAGKLTCLLGPSGCGKTTLLRIAAGLEIVQHGRVAIGERVLADGDDRRHVPPEERGIGLMFQDHALFPHLTVFENITFGLSDPAPGRLQWAREALARAGMAGFADAYPHTLSGGQQQRVALLRALAPEPRVLLLDEPFSDLDVNLRLQVREETLGLLKETGVTTLMVTHNPEEAMFMADHIAVMNEGRIIQAGTPVEIYFRPTDRFVAALFGQVNQFAGVVEGGRVHTPVGTFVAPGLADGRQAHVLVRAEGLRLAVAGTNGPSAGARAPERNATPARVISAHLLGRSSHVHLGADGPDGAQVVLHAHVPGVFLPDPGTLVSVSVDERQAFVFPDD